MSPVTHAMSRVPPLLPALRRSSPLGPTEVCPQRALGPRRQGRAPRSEGQGQKALLKREKPQDRGGRGVRAPASGVRAGNVAGPVTRLWKTASGAFYVSCELTYHDLDLKKDITTRPDGCADADLSAGKEGGSLPSGRRRESPGARGESRARCFPPACTWHRAFSCGLERCLADLLRTRGVSPPAGGCGLDQRQHAPSQVCQIWVPAPCGEKLNLPPTLFLPFTG